MYGCELWSLNDSAVSEFCVVWRKALRRVINVYHINITVVF